MDTEGGDVINHKKRRGADFDAAEELSETEGRSQVYNIFQLETLLDS